MNCAWRARSLAARSCSASRPTLCPVLVPQLVARVRRDYPKIELEIQQNGSMKLPDWLMDGRIDAAVMAQIGNDRYISAEPLAREEMVLLTAPGDAPAWRG